MAIRIRNKPGESFGAGAAAKHCAVRTNLRDWEPRRWRQWHREEAGSTEAAHAVIKNELCGGVMPCGRFGANAAWFRLAVLTCNVLAAMKRLALPTE